MNIAEMHVWFRQYAQQMGLQNVRALLPEQIDLLINTSISDMVNQLIRENIGLTNDRIVTDNSKLGQINAFRTLYKVAIIDMSPPSSFNVETKAFSFNIADRLTGRMTTSFEKRSEVNLIPDYLFLVDFSLSYKQVIQNKGYTGKNIPVGVYNIKEEVVNSDDYSASWQNIGLYNTVVVRCLTASVRDKTRTDTDYINLTFKLEPVYNSSSEIIGGKLKCITEGYTDYYLGRLGASSDTAIALNEGTYCLTEDFEDASQYYNDGSLDNPCVVQCTDNGYIQPSFDEEALETNYFPVRLIDDAYLADTLNDFTLKNRLRSPIIVTYNNGVFDLYIDKFKKVQVGTSTRYVLENNLVPYKFRMAYIAKPARVKYASDLGGENVDCDLPESMHVDILKHAVDLYTITINGSLQSAQAQQQNQNREISRNQVRPDNEGYQS